VAAIVGITDRVSDGQANHPVQDRQADGIDDEDADGKSVEHDRQPTRARQGKPPLPGLRPRKTAVRPCVKGSGEGCGWYASGFSVRVGLPPYVHVANRSGDGIPGVLVPDASADARRQQQREPRPDGSGQRPAAEQDAETAEDRAG
jgi:hypothetical protein